MKRIWLKLRLRLAIWCVRRIVAPTARWDGGALTALVRLGIRAEQMSHAIDHAHFYCQDAPADIWPATHRKRLGKLSSIFSQMFGDLLAEPTRWAIETQDERGEEMPSSHDHEMLGNPADVYDILCPEPHVAPPRVEDT